MNRLQERLAQAGRELGIRVIIGCEVEIDPRRRVVVDALLPQLGGPKGMVVVHDAQDIRSVANELTKLGYGYSVMSEPSDEYDLEVYIEVFKDWGWAVEEAKPDWME
jgi:hypothetical protein